MARDAIAEIIAYNRPGEGPAEATAEALRRKLSALANTPFQFLRGTFHLMACDVLQSRVSLARGTAPVGLIVGDLHLENFGVDRKSTRLNSSHGYISYAVFCLKKKKTTTMHSI